MAKKIQMDLDVDASKGKKGVDDLGKSLKNFESNSIKYSKDITNAWVAINKQLRDYTTSIVKISQVHNTSIGKMTAGLVNYRKELEAIIHKQGMISKISGGTVGGAGIGGAAVVGATAGAVAGAGKVMPAVPKEVTDTIKKLVPMYNGAASSVQKIADSMKNVGEATKKASDQTDLFNDGFIKLGGLAGKIQEQIIELNSFLEGTKKEIQNITYAIKKAEQALGVKKTYPQFDFEYIGKKIKQIGNPFANWILSPVSLKSFQKDLTRVLSIVKNITSFIMRWGSILATVAITAATIGFAKALVHAASKAEQLQMRLGSLTRDVEVGKRLFKDLAKWASTVPFEFEHIAEAATNLTGVFQGNAKQVMAYMPMIANLASGTGIDIKDVTSQVIRMYSAGARAADLFRERGVIAMMGFKFGVTYTAKETQKIMMEMVESSGSMFYKLSEKLATTWAGTISMLKDKWFLFRLAIMDSGPFIMIKRYLTDLNEWLNKAMVVDKNTGISQFQVMAAKTAKTVIEVFGLLAKAIVGVGNAVFAVIESFYAMKRVVIDVIGTAYSTWYGLVKLIREAAKYTMIFAGDFEMADSIQKDIDEASAAYDKFLEGTNKSMADANEEVAKYQGLVSDTYEWWDKISKTVDKLQSEIKLTVDEGSTKEQLETINNLQESLAEREKRWEDLAKAVEMEAKIEKKYSSEILEFQGKHREAELERIRVEKKRADEKSGAVKKAIAEERQLLTEQIRTIKALPKTNSSLISEGRRIDIEDMRLRLAKLSYLESESIASRMRNELHFKENEKAINRKYDNEIIDNKVKLNAEYIKQLGWTRDAELVELHRAYENDLEAFKHNKEIQLLIERNYQENVRKIKKQYAGEEMAIKGSAWENVLYGRDKAYEELETMNEMWQRLGENFDTMVVGHITDGMGQIIDAIYEGTLTWEGFAIGVQKASIEMLKSVTQMIMQTYLLNSLKGFFGGEEGAAAKASAEGAAKAAAVTAETAAISARMAALSAEYTVKVTGLGAETAAVGAATTAYIALAAAKAAAGAGGAGGGTSFGGGMAVGGVARAGTTYVVGEKGPELFTPSRTGRVTPNDQLGGATQVNVQPAEVAIFFDKAMLDEYMASPRGKKAQIVNIRSDPYAFSKAMGGR